MTFPVALILTLLLAHIDPVWALEDIQRRALNSAAPLRVNKPLLAIQIGSIVGAYVIFVALLLALLIFVGRRLRRTGQSSNYTLHMEMMKPKPVISLDSSPVSHMSHNLPNPTSTGFRSWGSLNRSVRPSQPSLDDSMLTIDESVVASNRQKSQDDMEMLYAAVMEHEDRKLQNESPDSQITNPFTDRGPHTSDHSLAPLAPQSPLTPKEPKAFKAPSKGFGKSRLSKLFGSSSRSSLESSKSMAMSKIPISSPLASPAPETPQYFVPQNPPLSPRIYNPGPPPMVPQLQVDSPTKTARSFRTTPTPLNLATFGSTPSPSSSLPFREAYPQQSAPATKTTFLDRPSQLRAGPATGMPTPYSPYMPFTPVTPFTPGRTVTKRQRKREERGNGLQVLTEDDLVKDNDDMWA
jgi:hypothetical protein